MEANKDSLNAQPSPEISHITKFNVDMPVASPKKKSYLLPILLGIISALAIFMVIWVVFLKRSPGDLLFFKKTTYIRDDKNNQATENLIPNPITGVKSKEIEAAVWKDLRPLAVMVNNHTDARPQSGLIYADVVYEIVAEGGITRFLAFFLSNTPEKIGPVRSTREYYLVLVKELGDAMLMHIGWSPQALEAIETWPVRSLGRGGGTFWRDNPRNVAIEHTAYTNGVELRKIGDALGWTGEREFPSWKFKDDSSKYAQMPQAADISIDFWYKGDYSAIFKYDSAGSNYLRFMGYDEQDQPIAHIDQETGKQIAVKNLIVQFVPEETIAGDDKNRLTYNLVGNGSALIFMDGKVIESTWTKAERDARTMFYDKNGQEIEFNRGQFWISIVPDRNVDQVVYN